MFLFMDGFSHYQTSDIIRKWTSKSDAFVTWLIEAAGRTDGCIKRTSTSNSGQPGYLLKGPIVNQTGTWTPQSSGICGFALKVDDLERVQPGGGQPNVNDISGLLLSIYNGSTAQCGISLNLDGTLSFHVRAGLGSNVPPVQTTISVINDNSWAFLEFKWTLSRTAGSFIIHANGIEIFNFSGPTMGDPYPFGVVSPNWTSVRVLGTASQNTPFLVMRMCDFYLLDTTGSVNNDFLGDVSIKYIKPDAAGLTADWTPVGSVNNWENVNEVPPNDDTDYNSVTAVNSVDLYGFEACGVNPLALQHCILGRRTVPGSATLQSIARPVATNHLSPAQSVRNETYEYNLFPYDTNPETGVRWTEAQVDGGQFGVNKAT